MKIRSSKNIHGFTLLEVMIALVIFSVGLLGLAGLQSRGLQSNTVAQFRTLAVIEAYDMADRIRANPVGIANGNYDNLNNSAPVAGADCLNAACTPQQIADLDYFEWINQLQQLLPSGHGTVTGNGAGSQFTVTVMWDEERTGVNGTGCSGDPNFDLKCYTLVFQP